jgi:hypothetical protein
MNMFLRRTLTVTFLTMFAISLLWAGANLRLTKPQQETSTEAANAPTRVEDTWAPSNEWIEIEGTVAHYEDNTLIVNTTKGNALEIGLGPLGYWLAHGIAFHPGDAVRVKGFYTDAFEPAEIFNLTTGESITLRNDDGSPVWRGDEH